MGSKRPTLMWVKAKAAVAARDCPRCGRAKGVPCMNLRLASWRPAEDIPVPHKERYGDEQFKPPHTETARLRSALEELPGEWSVYGRGVMFNHGKGDLTPEQRVGKWLREYVESATGDPA